MKKRLPILALCLLALLAPAARAGQKPPLVMTYVEWDFAVVSSHVAKVVIEEKLGVPVELLSVSVPVMWASIVSGDSDFMVTAWLPVTHANYIKRYAGQFDLLGTVLSGGHNGWVVPDYVPVKSIPELAKYKKEFGGQIIGIDAGSAYMELCEVAMKEYGLDDWELVDGSGATMAAALADAIRQNKWIVVTGWAPHWKFGRWKLHFLDEPKKVFGGEEEIRSVARLGLDKDFPEVHRFLQHFSFNDLDQAAQEMARNQEPGADPLANARKFVADHPDIVARWLR